VINKNLPCFKKNACFVLLFVCVLSFGCKSEDIGAKFKVDLTGKIKSVTLLTTEPAVNSLRYVFTYDEEGKQTGYELTDSVKKTTTVALYSRDSTGKLLAIVNTAGAKLRSFTYDRSSRLASSTFYDADSTRYEEQFTYANGIRDYASRTISPGRSFSVTATGSTMKCGCTVSVPQSILR
jgi:YD repeat-containing protein